MKAYMVTSFALYTALAVVLGVHNWLLFEWPWRLLALIFVPVALSALLMTFVACTTTYRR